MTQRNMTGHRVGGAEGANRCQYVTAQRQRQWHDPLAKIVWASAADAAINDNWRGESQQIPRHHPTYRHGPMRGVMVGFGLSFLGFSLTCAIWQQINEFISPATSPQPIPTPTAVVTSNPGAQTISPATPRPATTPTALPQPGVGVLIRPSAGTASPSRTPASITRPIATPIH